VLASFVPLFVGWPRRTLVRRILFGLLVACFAALCSFAVAAVSTVSTAFDRAGGRPGLLVGAALGGCVFMAALTWLAYRYPNVTLIAVLALLPLRLPLPLGGGSCNLLVPLYLLTLAMALAEIVVRDGLALPTGFRRDPARVALAIMITVLGVSSLWTGIAYAPRIKAFSLALVKLFAFIVPFATLYYLVERHLNSRLRLRRLIWAMLASGVALALIGIVQAPTHWVIINRAGVLDNEQMQHTFRANSLFWDPNMFGRFCALIVLLGVAMFLAVRAGGYRSRWRRVLPLSAAALAAIALALTYSRSGLISLLGGAVVIELAWLGWKKGLIAVLASVLVLAGGLTALTMARDTKNVEAKLSTTMGLNKLTGGRVYLVKAGWRMFERHPLRGIGLAGFPQAFPKYRTSHAAKLSLKESHTTPVTIAAEQGSIGLLAFAGLLATFFITALRKRRFGTSRDLYLMQAGLVGGVVALCVSSLSYNAFFEDPYLWIFLAMGSAVATRLVSPAQAVVAKGPAAGESAAGEPAGDRPAPADTAEATASDS
jgi:O-antigen ligase